jgi:hypothetical protein
MKVIGGGRSQWRNGLRPNSLVTGKITGNPEKIDAISLFQHQIPPQLSAFLDKFPAHPNREFYSSACEEQRVLSLVAENYLPSRGRPV